MTLNSSVMDSTFLSFIYEIHQPATSESRQMKKRGKKGTYFALSHTLNKKFSPCFRNVSKFLIQYLSLITGLGNYRLLRESVVNCDVQQ